MLRCYALAGALAIALPALADPPRPGQYSPVTAEEVPILKLHHYFTAEKKSQRPDFELTFTKDGFALKKGTGPIPAELQKKLLPDGAAADEIKGCWKLAKGTTGGLEIVFSGIKFGDQTGREQVAFPIYKTAPTVVRIGEPQYVFVIERK